MVAAAGLTESICHPCRRPALVRGSAILAPNMPQRDPVRREAAVA